MTRESLSFDILIIGAGPAGLAAAIRLKQLDAGLNVCVLEKAAEVGAHILSGAILDTRALTELIPDWVERNPPIHTAVTEDQLLFLTQRKAYRLPIPKPMKNKGHYIISLGQFCRWLAKEAEALGVEIYTGFSGAEIIYNSERRVIGILTGEKGLDKAGQPTAHYQPGIELLASYTLLAEGCHGSLSEKLIQQLGLRTVPQTYALGLKEIWEVPTAQTGLATHTIGWPLKTDVYGGSFIYHLNAEQIAIGLVISLDYQNPYLDPYEEFQRFKTHPYVRSLLKGGKRLTYGAKSLVEGGIQSLPQLSFAGGMLIGDSAGFLNAFRLKGIHNAMKSAMIAAESILRQENYEDQIKQSWIWSELHSVRNIRPAFRRGLWFGMAYAALDSYLFRGRAPWTFKIKIPDHLQLQPAEKPIDYPAPDGEFSFDRLSSVFLSQTHHREDQPVHLRLRNPKLAIEINWHQYRSPEQRYCPAGVYEVLNQNDKPFLQINASNCIHCKTCSIKDPRQNIEWVPPEGGDGPYYQDM